MQSKELFGCGKCLTCFFPQRDEPRGLPSEGSTGDSAPAWEEAQNCPESPYGQLCLIGFTPP